MNLMPIWIAGAGGLAIRLLNLSELYNIPKDKRPDLSDWLYWIQFVVFPGVGALLAWVYLEAHVDLHPVLALNIGVSAPLIMRTLADSIPRQFRGPVD